MLESFAVAALLWGLITLYIEVRIDAAMRRYQDEEEGE